MSKTFVASDLHLGHENIIRYCSRPFKGAAEMDTHLIDTWNVRVGVDDTVYFLGDFAMGPRVDDGFVAERLQYLNGDIRVVLGNHDQPISKYGMSGLKQVVKDFGLEDKVEVLSDIHEEVIDGVLFVMCHYPINDWDDRMKGSVHLHGHKHNGYSASRAREQSRQRRFDVGVDMYGGPVEVTGDLRFLNDPKGWKP